MQPAAESSSSQSQSQSKSSPAGAGAGAYVTRGRSSTRAPRAGAPARSPTVSPKARPIHTLFTISSMQYNLYIYIYFTFAIVLLSACIYKYLYNSKLFVILGSAWNSKWLSCISGMLDEFTCESHRFVHDRKPVPPT